MKIDEFGGITTNGIFMVKIALKVSQAIKIYCNIIAIEPKEFIKDAMVEQFIHSYIDINSEDFILVGRSVPEVKKPLKQC